MLRANRIKVTAKTIRTSASTLFAITGLRNPILFAAAGLSIERIGILAAVYPAVWGAGQLITGGLSDRIGRKWLIVGGMIVQAVALGMVAAGDSFGIWLAAASGIVVAVRMRGDDHP